MFLGVVAMVDPGGCFFLSYAHSPPLAAPRRRDPGQSRRRDPDQLVGKLFTDLSAAIKRHPAWPSGLRPGFYDQQIPAGADWKESISEALRAAQVFVPLYSPGYVGRSWPGTEWVRFRGRMERVGLADPEQRFVPVLWTPLFGPKPAGFAAALELGAGQPDYAANGLQALLRFSPYQPSYRTVLSRLADRIVTVAQESPLQPSDVPDIDMMESEFLTREPLAVFSVEIAAPTISTLPAGRDPATYGPSSINWSPFATQQLPLGEYVKQIAERLDFEVDVTAFGKSAGSEGRGPGIILIDPWYIADGERRSLLTAEVRRTPQWVLPLVVAGPREDTSTGDLATKVLDILGQAAHSVRSLDEVDTQVPRLIADAERRYLRHSGGALSGQRAVLRGRQGARPSLRGPKPPAAPTANPDPPGEATGA
jgi:FxsC-like protein